MISLQSLEKLELLKQNLRGHLPDALKIYGSLFSILKGNPFNLEVLVDSWPNYGAVMTRPLTAPPICDPYTNSYSFFIRDENRIHAVLEHINWNQAFEIQSMQNYFMNKIRHEAAQRNVDTEISLLRTYYQGTQKETGGEQVQRHQKNLEFCSLSPAYVSLVDDSWTFGRCSASQEYVSLCIKSHPSCCVLDSGIPVSWVLCDHYGAMRMLYTVPQERRKGLGSKVCSVLSEIMTKQNRPIYCHVEEENIPSQLMFKDLGLQETESKLLWVRSKSEHNLTGSL
ncbi:hypothetical protein XENTR_v10018477 [Xenopus tropicalis]|uniref:Glycine N-acyltransferase-like protein n=1 Tax=Xenopus tropicalis TaxID=8364 RepID=A0A6I8RQD3_XENTR|nr:glycine N-acyltransferase [Xenopus tropicalis]KAE8591513.1 hypothetical protein XENTR_v10018477 [Xenopus tropicalis]|eukprot:XP_002941419.1 PREDICTED: glycine N-acyltransferase-like [Xenopus tropicalis]